MATRNRGSAYYDMSGLRFRARRSFGYGTTLLFSRLASFGLRSTAAVDTWGDWLFPAVGGGEAGTRRRRIRTWLRNQN